MVPSFESTFPAQSKHYGYFERRGRWLYEQECIRGGADSLEAHKSARELSKHEAIFRSSSRIAAYAFISAAAIFGALSVHGRTGGERGEGRQVVSSSAGPNVEDIVRHEVELSSDCDVPALVDTVLHDPENAAAVEDAFVTGQEKLVVPERC